MSNLGLSNWWPRRGWSGAIGLPPSHHSLYCSDCSRGSGLPFLLPVPPSANWHCIQESTAGEFNHVCMHVGRGWKYRCTVKLGVGREINTFKTAWTILSLKLSPLFEFPWMLPWKLVAAFWYISGCWMILVWGAVLKVGVIITVCCWSWGWSCGRGWRRGADRWGAGAVAWGTLTCTVGSWGEEAVGGKDCSCTWLYDFCSWWSAIPLPPFPPLPWNVAHNCSENRSGNSPTWLLTNCSISVKKKKGFKMLSSCCYILLSHFTHNSKAMCITTGKSRESSSTVQNNNRKDSSHKLADT